MDPDLLTDILNCPSLPSLPAVAAQVLELTSDPDVKMSELADQITWAEMHEQARDAAGRMLARGLGCSRTIDIRLGQLIRKMNRGPFTGTRSSRARAARPTFRVALLTRVNARDDE